MNESPAAETPSTPPGVFQRWMRVVRILVLLVFAGVTAYGAYALLKGDWNRVAAFWLERRRLLLLVFLLSAGDISMDGIIWMALLRQQGIRPGLFRGITLYFTAHAAILMPAQLGRAFRATEVSRQCGASFSAVSTVELLLLFFVAVSSAATFVGAFLAAWSPLLTLPAMILLVFIALAMAQPVFTWFPRIPLKLPPRYFLRPSTLGLALLTSIGWWLNGINLYLIFSEVTASLELYQTVMIITSNLFIGVSTGLPGGLGITDTYIGAMMYWLKAPPEHLMLAVAAFRILTLWIWIPIGWMGLLLNMAFFGRPPSMATAGRDR